MSIGQGSITRTTPPAGTGSVTIAGARNGLSIDGANFVVIGRDQGGPLNVGELQNSRSMFMAGNQIGFEDGSIVLSDSLQDTSGGKLEIYHAAAAAETAALFGLFPDTSAAGSSLNVIGISATVPAPVSIGTPGGYLAFEINGQQSFFMAYDGQTFFKNPTNSRTYLAISDAVELLGAAGGQAVLQIEPVYNTSIPVGTFTDIFLNPSFAIAGGSAGVTQIMMAPLINQTAGGTGKFVGIQFVPGVTSITGQLIAYENTIGDVLLQSNATTGRTGVHNSGSLSAWLHIGPGAAAVGSAPLKLTTGTLQTTPETGAFEFDGTHLYFTIGATRNILI